MSQDRYGLYPLTLSYAGPTTLDVQQVGRWSIRSASNKEIIIPSGSIDPAAVILNFADPMVEVESDDVATILTAVSPTAGLACTGGAVFQLQQRAEGGTFTGAGANVLITSTVGFAYPKSISARQDEQGGAKLTLDYVAKWDGTADPLAITTAQDLTSTPAFNARFYLGPVYKASVLVPGIESWSLDFGIEYRTKRLDGDTFPKIGSIFSRKPKFTFQILKADYAGTVATLFNASPGAALNFYLRKGSAGGSRVADATAEHLKFSMATGAWNVDTMEVQGQDDATVTVACEPTSTISSNLATAIP